MVIRTETLPWPLDPELVKILEAELAKADLAPGEGAVITFRDPDFSADTGGFHPVEVAVSQEGNIIYITDFAYFGRPPHSELAKELDFDFALGTFQHFGAEFPLRRGYELFRLFQANFLAYHDGGAYVATVDPM
ncbi:DUF2787 family protein [Geomonas propionica]|uniref:DUF2787 family protein n=1 Tax=Geomonas propionica TaxID=2798582 RepID=A0ABS0YQL5_9BACT|nr:DUF2787 family protein [Geomonas propionica]MBJ6799747.1 DUF2787 family protein [Geomonas propionica]